jgi:serine/threonine protein kinase
MILASQSPFVLKRYRNLQMFNRELNVMQLGRVWSHFPRLIDSDLVSLTASISPQASGNLSSRTADFSIPLLNSVIEAALEVFPKLHAAGLVHGDVSPANFLLIEHSAESVDGNTVKSYDVIINDFSCSCPIGTQPDGYFGTCAFSPMAFLDARFIHHSFSGFSYVDIHDWESFAFLLLDLTCPPSSIHSTLPWMGLPDNLCHSTRAAYLRNFHTFKEVFLSDALRLHVGEQARALLENLFAEFCHPARSPQSSAIVEILTQYLGTCHIGSSKGMHPETTVGNPQHSYRVVYHQVQDIFYCLVCMCVLTVFRGGRISSCVPVHAHLDQLLELRGVPLYSQLLPRKVARHHIGYDIQ